MLIWYQCIFFGQVSVQVFCSFLIRLFSYCCILRILSIFWITAISVQFSSVVSNSLRPHKSPFTDTFFSSLCLVFSFSWQSSTGQKLLVCLESSLSIIYFTEHILVLSVKRHCPTQGHLGFPLCFFPEVLYFCLLHVGLWSTFHSFLWAGAKSIFRFAFFFFFAWGCLVSPA